jgi:2-polyprenyl-3-methyl-5-hydroxy-6-metoxy-1,4-benzoquinol methylase
MPTKASASEIRDDFDAIAQLTPDADRFGPHEAWLLEHLPSRRGTVLEIGCGVGHTTRRLASRFDRVIGIDLSEGMIAEARRRTTDLTIEYRCVDMFEWLRDASESYDCIVTIATLHHVDLESALLAMAASLKPGGRLLVLDLVDRHGLFNNGAAFVAARLHELMAFHGMAPWKLRRAYWRHGHQETYLTIDEVRRVAMAAIPGSAVREHLMWRYSIVWDKLTE